MNREEVLKESTIGIVDYRDFDLSILQLDEVVIESFFPDFERLERSQREKSLLSLRKECAKGNESFAFYHNNVERVIGQIGGIGPSINLMGKYLQPIFMIVDPDFHRCGLSRVFLSTSIEANLQRYSDLDFFRYVPQVSATGVIERRLREFDPNLITVRGKDDLYLKPEAVKKNVPIIKTTYGINTTFL